MDQDSIGSSVECIIEGLPIGVGEPWFDGLEPAFLARGMMAIPGARAVEFSRGIQASKMRVLNIMMHGSLMLKHQSWRVQKRLAMPRR